MKNVQIKTVKEIQKFLEGNENVDFEIVSRKDKYSFINDTLVGTRYKNLRKKDKGTVKIFLEKVTRYEKRHIKRLVKRWKEKGLRYVKRKVVGASACIYKPVDIDLLIKTEIFYTKHHGLTTKAILMRELITFGNIAYQTIANISVSHIYNVIPSLTNLFPLF